MKSRRTQIIALLATIIVVCGFVLVPQTTVKAQIAGIETPSYTGSILANGGAPGSEMSNDGMQIEKEHDNALQGAGMWSAVAAFIVNNIILPIGDAFLSIMGVLLNGVMILTLNMSSLVSGTGNVVDTTWSVIRDISSILIIFFLLFSAIEIIIGTTDSKVRHLIVMVVIAGILINFSLFFTKIAVDASNLVSLAFYRAMSPSGANYDFSAQAGSTNYLQNAFTSGGISNEVMQGLAIQTIYMQASSTAGVSTDPLLIISAGIGGFIIMIITGLSFLAAAILFTVRIGILIILMAFSPFYFLGMIMPELKTKISNKWKDHLLHQCFIMPVYMLFMYVALRVITNPSFGSFMNPAKSGSILSAGTNNTNTVIGLVTTGTIGLVMQYIIGMILVSIPLLAAMEYASFGKEWAGKATGKLKEWTGGAIGFAGGMAASKIIESRAMKNFHTSNPNIAGVIHGRLSNVADSSGYTKSKKAQEKRMRDIHKTIGTVNRSDYVQGEKGDEEFKLARRSALSMQKDHIEALRSSSLSKIMGVHGLSYALEKEHKTAHAKEYLEDNQKKQAEIDKQIEVLEKELNKQPIPFNNQVRSEVEEKELKRKIEELEEKRKSVQKDIDAAKKANAKEDFEKIVKGAVPDADEKPQSGAEKSKPKP